MKTISIIELTELLTSQEEEIRGEYTEKVARIARENERLSICLMDEYRRSKDIAERLETTIERLAKFEKAIPKKYQPIIVGVLPCDAETVELGPCMSDPEPQTPVAVRLDQEQEFSRAWLDQHDKLPVMTIPCLDDSSICVNCSS